MNEINIMDFEIKLKGEMSIKEVAEWINRQKLSDRIQVFAQINLGFDEIDQSKKIFITTVNSLVESDLSESELLTLLSTFKKLSDKVLKKLNN